MSNGRNLGLLLGPSPTISSDKLPAISGGGTSISEYDSDALLPLTENSVTDLAFVTSKNELKIWNGTQWLDINRTVGGSYYFINAGSFEGSVIGTERISPSVSITLETLEATIDQISNTTINFNLMKNNQILQSFAIPNGQTQISASFTSGLNIITTDELSLNIVSGSGKDLVVKLNYKEI